MPADERPGLALVGAGENAAAVEPVDLILQTHADAQELGGQLLAVRTDVLGGGTAVSVWP